MGAGSIHTSMNIWVFPPPKENFKHFLTSDHFAIWSLHIHILPPAPHYFSLNISVMRLICRLLIWRQTSFKSWLCPPLGKGGDSESLTALEGLATAVGPREITKTPVRFREEPRNGRGTEDDKHLHSKGNLWAARGHRARPTHCACAGY